MTRHAGVSSRRTACSLQSARRFWKREAQNQIAAAAAALAAARSDGHEFLAVDHVDGGRREDAAAGVELPQQFAGPGVVREEIPGNVAARADEHHAARGDDRSRLSPAVER